MVGIIRQLFGFARTSRGIIIDVAPEIGNELARCPGLFIQPLMASCGGINLFGLPVRAFARLEIPGEVQAAVDGVDDFERRIIDAGIGVCE